MLHSLYTPKLPHHKSLPNLVISVEQGKLVEVTWQNETHNQLVFVEGLSLGCADCVLIFKTEKQLDEYFLGNRTSFELPLYFGRGTDFQKQVWTELTKINYGETISYKELAIRLSKPTAFRAVANANGKNPFSLIVPCHRVIASGGGLGGYTGGVAIKEVLLKHEQEFL